MGKEYTFKFLTQDNLGGFYQIKGQEESKEISEITLNEPESLEILYLFSSNLTDISPLKELKNL